MTTKTAAQLLDEPHLANLRRQAELFDGLPLCEAVAQHPRNGLRPCLTVLDSEGRCANVHRHVEAR